MIKRPRLIGILSDTHGLLRPEVAAVFAGVELIIHAGDVGSRRVLEALSAIAPTEAVSGNVDDRDNPMLPRHRSLPVGDLTLHVSHGDELGQPNPERVLAHYDADILVFGHTHKGLVYRDPAGRLVINPGAAGPRRFSLPATVALLTVDGRDARAELVTLL